jgi:nucleoid DNA-binding protein
VDLGFLKTTLQTGKSIKIEGFGKFTVRNKRARQGRNPRTGEPISISARRVVTFQASRLFKAHKFSISRRTGRGGVIAKIKAAVVDDI